MRRVDDTRFYYDQELRFGTFENVWQSNRVIPPHHDPACWGCGNAPAGIRLPQPAAEGLTEYEAWFHFDERHQAAPGLVHGGLVAAALDEACGLLATWYRFPAVTARIFVRYRQPVRDQHGAPRARAARRASAAAGCTSTASSTDGSDVLAEARAAFLHVPLEHFLATPEGRAAADAWSARSTMSGIRPERQPIDADNDSGSLRRRTRGAAVFKRSSQSEFASSP